MRCRQILLRLLGRQRILIYMYKAAVLQTYKTSTWRQWRREDNQVWVFTHFHFFVNCNWKDSVSDELDKAKNKATLDTIDAELRMNYHLLDISFFLLNLRLVDWRFCDHHLLDSHRFVCNFSQTCILSTVTTFWMLDWWRCSSFPEQKSEHLL